MVNFTFEDVADAFVDELVNGNRSKFLRLRDAVQRDVMETGSFESYQRFITYTIIIEKSLEKCASELTKNEVQNKDVSKEAKENG